MATTASRVASGIPPEVLDVRAPGLDEVVVTMHRSAASPWAFPDQAGHLLGAPESGLPRGGAGALAATPARTNRSAWAQPPPRAPSQSPDRQLERSRVV